jgi:hypothetical protein
MIRPTWFSITLDVGLPHVNFCWTPLAGLQMENGLVAGATRTPRKIEVNFVNRKGELEFVSYQPHINSKYTYFMYSYFSKKRKDIVT